jgi:hypothetical protein
MPVNPNTQRQVDIRTFVSGITIAWQNVLTQIQRDAWEVYASNIPWKNKLGQVVFLTGFNHYVRSNVVRMQVTPNVAAVVRVDDAPIIFNLATPEQTLSVTLTAAGGTMSVIFDDTADWNAEAGGFQAVYQGLPQNAGINFFGGPYRYANAMDGGGPAVSPIVIPVSYPIALGQRVWVRTRVGRLDARLSEFSYFNVIVAA